MSLCFDRFVASEERFSSDTKWHVKCPFTANSLGYRENPDTPEEAVDDIMRIAERNFNSGPHPTCIQIPYVMLQERVLLPDTTKKTRSKVPEMKLVFLNGKCAHSKGVQPHRASALAPFTNAEVQSFAKGILQGIAEHHSPPFILDGLTRVDLFKSNTGKLVVNELESLNADHRSSNVDESATLLFLQNYWIEKLILYIGHFNL